MKVVIIAILQINNNIDNLLNIFFKLVTKTCSYNFSSLMEFNINYNVVSRSVPQSHKVPLLLELCFLQCHPVVQVEVSHGTYCDSKSN